jgi:hypothetical protein
MDISNPLALLGLFSPAEISAIVYSLACGWFITEGIKRFLVRKVRTSREQDSRLYPVIAFVVTLASAIYLWPKGGAGTFPHPILAGVLLAFAAPTLYAMLIYLLRWPNVGWMTALAGAITGERRRRDVVPPGNIDRRNDQ